MLVLGMAVVNCAGTFKQLHPNKSLVALSALIGVDWLRFQSLISGLTLFTIRDFQSTVYSRLGKKALSYWVFI